MFFVQASIRQNVTDWAAYKQLKFISQSSGVRKEVYDQSASNIFSGKSPLPASWLAPSRCVLHHGRAAARASGLSGALL